ncbi:ATPase [Macleaya cordata]|uniref:ATPase n=1 Tax=Macleaya cordata TaxID=56857 RepID=A0A200QWC7_MACCD|nr:ATPase [Macleaya cordata]
MDTLSTSVSTNRHIHGFPSTAPRELHHQFRPPQTTHHQLPPPNSHLYNKPNSLLSNRPTSPSSFTNNKTLITSSHPFTSTAQTSSSAISKSKSSVGVVHHRKASCGYAAALLDIAQCNNNLNLVERDVRRFLRLIRYHDVRTILADPSMDDKTKGEVVKEIAVKGKFQKHLVVMVKMLVEKNRVCMVNEVLEEFERINDELNGTRVVWVSSAEKMKEDQLFGIARRVQNVMGATKVKVRHLINQSFLPSFAV